MTDTLPERNISAFENADIPILSPRTQEELNPASMLYKDLAKKFRQTHAVKEALETVRKHIVHHGLRTQKGDLIISDDWRGEKGEKIVSFLASFSELAHIAAASSVSSQKQADPKEVLENKRKIKDKIQTAMDIMVEYLDHGYSPEQLKEFFKGYHQKPAQDNAVEADPTRIKLANNQNYLHFPVLEVAEKNNGSKNNPRQEVTLLDLVESASLVASEQLKSTSHAQEVNRKPKGSIEVG